MKNPRDTELNVAFVYDPKAYYLERGYAETDCADLADEVTINAVANALGKLGHRVVHIPGIKHLVGHLAAGEEKNWDLVFNFSEGLRGSARESQVPALLEAYEVLYTFSDAATLSLCNDKAKTKMLLEHYRIPTSPFALIPKFGLKADYASLAKELSYPLFAKPVAASTSNGILPSNKIYRHEDLDTTIENLRGQFKGQEIMLEEFLGGREFTVAILGTNSSATVLGVLEVTWYNPEGHENDNSSVDFATSFSKAGRGPGQDMGHAHADLADPLVKKVANVALSAYQVLGCRDGARVDIRLTSQMNGSVPNVIEVNPLFGLRDDFSLFTCIARNNGMEYHELIAEVITSALQRRNQESDGSIG
ncbi:ATP-grasp fold subdomain 1 [Penicillium riverlandense]|uniref:ATP-grasp fold subdomain 1 n=1 Tax=Penicillium riverlandense TaxID=1903569 RepID=UPI00254722D3|nr:ATP-grasp fold subdomain 1 [Penicillium riverlandense]KAJ5814778.1 ATP-grasp fold subdomain 1 [Penicillium riverlandense]